MSLLLHDPFFDGFEDYMANSRLFPLTRLRPMHAKDEESDTLSTGKRLRRDVITPFSGFGRMDMRESDMEYELNVDAPGMEKDDFTINTENNLLTIEGKRKEDKEGVNSKYHFRERHFGEFRREISLPSNVKIDSIHATYTDGVLKVVIPKKEHPVEKKSIIIH